MSNKLLGLSALALSLLLAGCGGSSSESNSVASTSGTATPIANNNPSTAAVNGQFRQSSETGKYFGFDFGTFYLNDMNVGAIPCQERFNDYYFETDNAYIYGPQSLPDSDFFSVAGWIENNLDATAQLMGQTDFASMIAHRNDIAPELNSMLYDSLILQELDSVTYPSDFEAFMTSSFDEQMQWFSKYFRDLDRESQNAVLVEVAALSGIVLTDEAEYRLGDKILVCINQNTSPFEYAHAGRLGISIAAPSVQPRDDAEPIMVHEIIHLAQFAAFDSGFNKQTIPRWFSEGQALYLAGQPIANRNEGADYKVPSFITPQDENSVDVADVYRHYGLAYRYLHDANGTEKMMELLDNIDASEFHYFGNFPTDELIDQVNYNFNDGFNSHSMALIDAFDSTNLVDANGQTLTLERFKRDYEMLIR